MLHGHKKLALGTGVLQSHPYYLKLYIYCAQKVAHGLE